MKSVFIIAEAGVNHNGDLKLAKELVDAASKAGANAVKFQTFRAENIAAKHATKANYQLETTDRTQSQLEMLKKLELSKEQHLELKEYCGKKEIQFLSTPFDIESVKLLQQLGMEIIKIPSGEITNYPYLKFIGKLKKKVILSTGMADLEEIGDALRVLKSQGTKDITILHCTTQYPTPYEDVNLLAMDQIREAYELDVGYSDHTLGIEASVAAAARGATVIEKHITLDRNMEGPDHKASLEPSEFREMVDMIRKIEVMLGDGIKKTVDSERANMAVARKSIVAAKHIKEGEWFTEENLTVKRPGTGINPMMWKQVIGQRAFKDFKKDEMIQLEPERSGWNE